MSFCVSKEKEKKIGAKTKIFFVPLKRSGEYQKIPKFLFHIF